MSGWSDSYLELAKTRYEQEISYMKHLDSKGMSLIGFAGVTVSLLSILYSGAGGFLTVQNFGLLSLGIFMMFISIFFGLVVLTPLRRTRPAFNVPLFYNDTLNDDDPIKKEKAYKLFNSLTTDAKNNVRFKAGFIYAGNILLGLGILISFLSLFKL